MSIQTRSTATLVARLQEIQREQEEIVTELGRRAAENEPADNEDDDEEVMPAEEPNFEWFPEEEEGEGGGGGNPHTGTNHTLMATLSGLTFNQEAPNWQAADWPPLPFDSRPDQRFVASVVVDDPAGHTNKSSSSTVVLLSTQRDESNAVHFLQMDDSTQNLCWRIGPSMNRTRMECATVVCRGYLYAIGGIQCNLYPSDRYDTMERIDIQDLLGFSSNGSSPPTNNHWTTLECRLSKKRCGCSAVVVKERFIVVAGGEDYTWTHTSIDILDTAASTQSPSHEYQEN